MRTLQNSLNLGLILGVYLSTIDCPKTQSKLHAKLSLVADEFLYKFMNKSEFAGAFASCNPRPRGPRQETGRPSPSGPSSERGWWGRRRRMGWLQIRTVGAGGWEGGARVYAIPQIVTDQLNLNQAADYVHLITTCPPGISDLPTALDLVAA